MKAAYIPAKKTIDSGTSAHESSFIYIPRDAIEVKPLARLEPPQSLLKLDSVDELVVNDVNVGVVDNLKHLCDVVLYHDTGLDNLI